MVAGGNSFKYSGGGRGNDPAWRVVIAPGPSRQAMAWIALVGSLALAAALASGAHPFAKAGVAFALGWACVGALRRHAWRVGPAAVREFATGLDGRIEVRRVAGPHMAGRLARGSFVAPWLVVLYWVPDGVRYSRPIFLLPDMAGERELRRLRVLLRWGGSGVLADFMRT
jgi:hypothetical protein